MLEKNSVYLVGVGWIWVSALARYYLSKQWKVYWSDSNDSHLIDKLISEWADIIIWSDSNRITKKIDLVIYSEAVPSTQSELLAANELGIKMLKYNVALAEIANEHRLIAVAWTHWKSTTTSMISQILKKSTEDFWSVVWTLLKEFHGKNFFSRGKNNFFVIEACEYKEHFLAYKPHLAVITNIEYDHADYFKTPKSYVKAFEDFINKIIPWWFCVINWDDTNAKTLIWLRDDIHYILVSKESYSTIFPTEKHTSNTEYYPEIVLNVPGEHILFDAKIAFIVSQMIGIPEIISLETLEDYSGVWRRMEKIGTSDKWNLIMSDYGHHPTEIITTLKAIKSWYPDKQLYVVFQPHQYSRTIELLDWFKDSFKYADTVIIPNIYESRDSDDDKAAINTKKLVSEIHHNNIHDGISLEHTTELIYSYDRNNPNSSIILLLGAWDVDTLRYKIKTS